MSFSSPPVFDFSNPTVPLHSYLTFSVFLLFFIETLAVQRNARDRREIRSLQGQALSQRGEVDP